MILAEDTKKIIHNQKLWNQFIRKILIRISDDFLKVVCLMKY